MNMTFSAVKRLLIGEPFPTSREVHERLDKVRGLAIFSSDTISSNAYATEAIMHVLIVLGSGGLALTLPLALAVAALVLLVVFSYIQTIMHYPDGGGAYTVAKDNLGRYPSLMAAAALLTDYVLTVAVSTSAGVRAVTSAFPETLEYRVIIALLAIGFITWINLRGVRESGTIFAFPTYAFVGGLLLVIIIGFVRYFELFGVAPLPVTHEVVLKQKDLTGVAYIWLLLRAFSGGCTAMTGIEAVSNGVQAFKPPESRNAAQTMIVMGVLAMILFIGVASLATTMKLIPGEGESILSQLTRHVSGSGVLYYWVQAFTALILFLAANTGYQDFPRLSSFLAKDGFMPRWMQNRGDRLVYSMGILTLALLSSGIVLIFGADEIAMLPLYALGVMLSFTLSQAGMSRLMKKVGSLQPGESLFTGVTTIHYEKNWRWKQHVNQVGAVVTAVVFAVLVATKFLEGAWLVALVIPLLVYLFDRIHVHYEQVATALSTSTVQESDLIEVANVVIVPIADVHRGTLLALQYAKRLSNDVRAVCISTSPQMRERVTARWARFPRLTAGIRLDIIDYDYRDILKPLEEYIAHINRVEFPDQLVTVVVPEFISPELTAQWLHNQTATVLRARLHHMKDLVVISVPFHITEENGQLKA
ncbi:MAG: APC family permease [Anaerolineae bacterium]|nr:APC family permease [Anaerolineae bacterium]